MSTSSRSCRRGSERGWVNWTARRVRKAIIVLGTCAVTILGCASPERPERDSLLSRPGSQVVTPPLSSAAYQETLRSAGGVVAPSFERLTGAGSAEDAATALMQASTATLEAEQLLDVNPPTEVLTVHADLRAGLRQLATDMSRLGRQVMSMELCAMPSIVAAVSNASGVASLRTVRDDLGSGRLGASYQWGEFLPVPTPLPDRRLANGKLIDSQRRNGRGQLKVDNGAEHDAVVKLVQGGRPMVSVYVGKGSSATVGQISDGSYEMFYTSGEDWDNQLKVFTRSCQFKRFEEPVIFSTTSVNGGIRYTIQTVGLQPRVGGNARTTQVSPQSFPR